MGDTEIAVAEESVDWPRGKFSCCKDFCPHFRFCGLTKEA